VWYEAAGLALQLACAAAEGEDGRPSPGEKRLIAGSDCLLLRTKTPGARRPREVWRRLTNAWTRRYPKFLALPRVSLLHPTLETPWVVVAPESNPPASRFCLWGSRPKCVLLASASCCRLALAHSELTVGRTSIAVYLDDARPPSLAFMLSAAGVGPASLRSRPCIDKYRMRDCLFASPVSVITPSSASPSP
jgi:hypothetical protein